MWQYGTQALVVQATIGEYVFQNDPARAAVFTSQPSQITKQSVSGSNQTVGDSEMAIWDPAAAKLYPLVPGQFKAKWAVSPGSTQMADVTVKVAYPSPAHYPHVVNTPGVALDPDPNDDFI